MGYRTNNFRNRKVFMYSIILFDLDDTLLDFSSSEHKGLVSIHQLFYKAIPFEKFEKHFKEINTALWNRVGAQNHPLLPSDIRSIRFGQLNEALDCSNVSTTAVAEAYDLLLGEHADWILNVKSAIEFLYQKGHTMGVVTNGLAKVQDIKYKRHQLEQWFDCFIVSDRVGFAKPSREIFNCAFDELAYKKNHTSSLDSRSILMVGDSIASDGYGAQNLGIDFCFINPQATNTIEAGLRIKYDIQSVAQLPACLGYGAEYNSLLSNCEVAQA